MELTITKNSFDEFVRSSADDFRHEYYPDGYKLSFGISLIGYTADWCVTDYCIDLIEYDDINEYSIGDIIRICVGAENNLADIPEDVYEVFVLLEALAVDNKGSYSFLETNVGMIHVVNGRSSTWRNN